MEDIREICKDCGEEFVISTGEQGWLEEHGFAPFKRCKQCRNKRKNQNRDRE